MSHTFPGDRTWRYDSVAMHSCMVTVHIRVSFSRYSVDVTSLHMEDVGMVCCIYTASHHYKGDGRGSNNSCTMRC